VTVGVLTGLTIEARLVRAIAGPNVLVAATGADPSRATRCLQELVTGGATALLSFGLAAGLDPVVRAGDLVVADGVRLPDGRVIPSDIAWRDAAAGELAAASLSHHRGVIAASGRLLVSEAEKREVFGATGAVAADMESGAAAAVAAALGLPFLALRAISDTSSDPLPAVAQVPPTEDGGIDAMRVARALLTRPGEWRAVVRLATSTRAAMRTLGRLPWVGPQRAA
jgi:adenosylhomocysteine nucleosidase